MSADDEHDDGTVVRAVRQFRRLARRVGADPLRLLAVEPLAGLEPLAAPAAALIDLAPFERLHETLAPPAGAAAAAPVRGRVYPLGARRPRSQGSPPLPDRASDSAGGRPAAARRRAEHDAPVLMPAAPHTVPLGATPATPPAAALAQRRAELRRRGADQGAGLTPPLPAHRTTPAGQIEALPPTRPIAPALRPASRPAAGRQRPPQTSPAPPLTDPATIGNSAFRRAPAALQVPESRPPGNEAASAAATAAAATAAAAAAAESGAAATPMTGGGHPRPGPAATPVAAPRLATTATPDIRVTRPQRAAAAGGEPARRPQPGNRSAGLELADDLFEALYRGGVDVSWP
jgi:hypothetical protein